MKEIFFNQAIGEAINEEMSRDETVFLLGENASKCVWGTSAGEYEKFGKERVLDTAISEAAIIGSCVGAALAGFRPVANLMFADFFVCGGDELLQKAAKWRFEHGGKVKVPAVFRAACGGYSGLGPDHSQCMESLVMGTPGLKVAIPSNPYDAKGLLKTAIRDDNPVVYLEHKVLMRARGPIPEEEYTVPFGQAELKRQGSDVTVVAIGLMVSWVMSIADIFYQERGLNLEVIDPRTLEPLDIETIVDSVERTGHLVIVDENTMRCGPAAEIGMQIMEKAFDFLDAPVKRVTAANYPIAAGYLEQYILPQPQQIADSITDILDMERIDLKDRITSKASLAEVRGSTTAKQSK